MKKLFFTLCALCLCGTMWGQTIDEATGLYYTLDESNNATIVAVEGVTYGNDNLVSYTGDEATNALTLPATVGEDYPVVAVGAQAFQAANIEGHFVLPSYVNTVGAGAFMDCAGITDVTIEYSATTLTDQNTAAYTNMFYDNTGLKTVTLNRNISSRTGSAYAPFSYQHTITTITIGEHVGEIPDMMFRDDKYNYTITSVTCYAEYPPSMSATAHPFDRCFSSAGAVPLYVPSTSIQYYMDEEVWTTVFGENIQEIEGYVVPEPEQPEGTLRDVTTKLYFEIGSDGVVSIVKEANGGVYSDDNLVANEDGSYTLPYYVEDKDGQSGSVTRIATEAFENAYIEGHLVIPAFITAIGEDAFTSCTHITEVTYEYSDTPLADENNCTAGNMYGGSFHGCTGITTVNLYRDISYSTSAQQPGAFVGLSNITTLNIGPRVTSIYNYMFRNGSSATSLATINCYSINPPTLGTGALGVLPTGYVVNVPQGTLSDYQTSWSDYTLAEMSNAFAITTHDNGEGSAYATFYNSASDVELFDDGTGAELTAYVAYQLDEEDDGLYIEIESIGNTVPAGTGVIVETLAEGTYLAIATGEKTSYSGDNDLYGFDTAETTVGPDTGSYYYYLLSSYDNQVGFYYGADGGGAFTCQAHRAYLALEQGSGSQGISIRKGSGEDTTGISSVESATEGASVKGIYTIQGVRVSNMNQPGLYIVDGKKVLVK